MERLFVPLTVAEWHEISIEAIVRGTSRPAELRRRAGLPPLEDGRKANGRRRPPAKEVVTKRKAERDTSAGWEAQAAWAGDREDIEALLKGEAK